MDINFDFKSFQDEITSKLSQCISESFDDEDTDMQDVSDGIDEANISYKKIQKILNTPEMEKCHPWLYSLDMENLNEDEANKVDKIYDLGVKRGVIQEDDDTEDTENVDECGDDLGDSDTICGGPDDALTNQEMTPQETEPTSYSDSSFTVLYSAIKDGKIKTGEYYSNALDNEGAKEDCVSNLTQVGYSAIRILGIEKTNTAVDTNVDNVEPDVNMYDGLEEDDSEEFEKQETDDVDTTDDKESDVSSDEKQDDVVDDKTEDTDKKEEQTDDKEIKDDSDKEENKNNEQKDDEDTEDDSDDKEKDEKLSTEEKKALKDDYTSTFRSILFDMKLEKSVEEMTLSEKNDFYSKLAKKWTKNDPSEFMTDKEQERLNKIVIKK